MKNRWIFSIAFLILCALRLQGAQYQISISFYHAVDTTITHEYYSLEASTDREAIETAYDFFCLGIYFFDKDYVNLLYHRKNERDSLPLPVDYNVYLDFEPIKLPHQYSIEALYRRLKNDYWGECYLVYDATFLPWPSIIEKKKKNSSKKSNNESYNRYKKSKNQNEKVKPLPPLPAF